MRTCSRIKSYDGKKSNKIMGMINTVQKNRLKVRLPSIIKNKNLLLIDHKIKETEKHIEELRTLLKKCKDKKETLLDKLGLYYDEYGEKRYVIQDGCFITIRDKEKLQNAQDLWSIGKVKEANEIWNAMITKHGIGGKENGR